MCPHTSNFYHIQYLNICFVKFVQILILSAWTFSQYVVLIAIFSCMELYRILYPAPAEMGYIFIWWLASASDSCLMRDYAHVINFCIIIIIISCPPRFDYQIWSRISAHDWTQKMLKKTNTMHLWCHKVNLIITYCLYCWYWLNVSDWWLTLCLIVYLFLWLIPSYSLVSYTAQQYLAWPNMTGLDLNKSNLVQP